jgi:ABC-type polysaccharide/polyol phosphate transport system ATPase subunit
MLASSPSRAESPAAAPLQDFLPTKPLAIPKPSAASAPAAAKPDEEGVLLSVQGVSKHYSLWQSPSERLQYSLLSQAHKTLRSVLPRDSAPVASLQRKRDALARDFVALQELSFDLRRGESMGIIGRNGSGKSTLLQIIAGTLRPTTGRVEVRGRIAALLELGSGFNLEFTGRENVYLNGSILGFSKDEIDKKFDSIASFADIGQFLDQPAKTYSSGMLVRLAFSVQMAVEPALFIIDEALAVGDIYFQSKCNKMLRAKLDEGLTILLVSHNPAAVRALCQRGLVLDQGRCAFQGASDRAVNVYHELGDQRRGGAAIDSATLAAEEQNKETAPAADTLSLPPLGRIEDEIGSREVLITGCGLFNAAGKPCRDFTMGETIRAGFAFRSEVDDDEVQAGFVIRDRFGNAVTAMTTANQKLPAPKVRPGGTYTIFLTLLGRLGPGEYLLDFGIGTQPNLAGNPGCHYHRVAGIASFSISPPAGGVPFQGICDVGAEFRWGQPAGDGRPRTDK